MKKKYLISAFILLTAAKVVNAQSTSTSPLVISPATGSYYNITSAEDTKGSRYLFNVWAKGSVIDMQGNLIKDDTYGFNYDKISGAFLLTKDKNNAIEVNKDQIKTFTVIDQANLPMTFEYYTAVDPVRAAQVLSAGSKYKIYKLTKTKFVKANFKTDGMSSSGNKYDEYVNEPVYYVLDLKVNTPQKITLKSKAIKQVFAADADKVNAFLTDHKADEIDDKFLSDLGAYLNK